MPIKTANGWKTCDIKVAAFLLHMNFAVVSCGKHDKRAFFEFEDTEERKEAVLGFWNKTQTVEPTAFLESLNRARDMVTQAMNS